MQSDTPRTDAKDWMWSPACARPGEPLIEEERVVDAKFARELERELAAAIKQRDEAVRDAERYRWMKSAGCDWVEIRSRPGGYLIFQGRHGHAFLHHGGNAEMDDVIDSEMRRGKS